MHCACYVLQGKLKECAKLKAQETLLLYGNDDSTL